MRWVTAVSPLASWRHLELSSALLDRGGLIRHLDGAKPLLLGCQLVDSPHDQLRRFRFLCLAASIDRKARTFNPAESPGPDGRGVGRATERGLTAREQGISGGRSPVPISFCPLCQSTEVSASVARDGAVLPDRGRLDDKHARSVGP